MTVVESLIDYKKRDSSKVECLKDNHVMGEGDKVRGTTMLLKWDKKKRLTSEKKKVRGKESILCIK